MKQLKADSSLSSDRLTINSNFTELELKINTVNSELGSEIETLSQSVNAKVSETIIDITPNSTGTQGTIYRKDDYIYFCVADNKWVRSSIEDVW